LYDIFWSIIPSLKFAIRVYFPASAELMLSLVFLLPGLICRYEIVSNRKNIPFEIEVKNKETGEALLKVKKGAVLSYEKRKHYKFNIFAYDCEDPPYSKKSNR
jgi:hypothetical protein